VQNEPKATQIWDSCVFTAEEERDFVKNHLGPILEKEGLKDIKIIIWDHNKERLYERAKIEFSDPKASKYIYGAGFHWYSGDHFGALDAVHHNFPDKKLIFTEGSQEGGVKLGSFATGERYGHDILGNLNNWMTAWCDWNLVLDEMGGPNHVGNYCDAPIIADTINNSVTYESSFYYIGQFSKFIKPGAKRIGTSSYTDKLEVTAFKNPDSKIVVVILNRTDNDIFFILSNENGLANVNSIAHSIMTLIY
jgi:glucosylceramidase